VSGFRNDTAVHKINSPKSGFRRALNSISVITLLLLTRACPSDFLLSSSQSQPFCNPSLIFLFICQDASPLLDRSTLSGPKSPHILPYILFTGAAASRNDCYSTLSPGHFMVDACELLRDPSVQTQNPRVQGVKDVT
jgi:hypothetical protein